jgi:hypothetical protein
MAGSGICPAFPINMSERECKKKEVNVCEVEE